MVEIKDGGFIFIRWYIIGASIGYVSWYYQYSIENTFLDSRLKSKKGNLAFGVEVVKCDQIDLGSVMLYLNNDRLVAVAHSIGPEHMPSSKQVRQTFHEVLFKICLLVLPCYLVILSNMLLVLKIYDLDVSEQIFVVV